MGVTFPATTKRGGSALAAAGVQSAGKRRRGEAPMDGLGDDDDWDPRESKRDRGCSGGKGLQREKQPSGRLGRGLKRRMPGVKKKIHHIVNACCPPFVCRHFPRWAEAAARRARQAWAQRRQRSNLPWPNGSAAAEEAPSRSEILMVVALAVLVGGALLELCS